MRSDPAPPISTTELSERADELVERVHEPGGGNVVRPRGMTLPAGDAMSAAIGGVQSDRLGNDDVVSRPKMT